MDDRILLKDPMGRLRFIHALEGKRPAVESSLRRRNARSSRRARGVGTPPTVDVYHLLTPGRSHRRIGQLRRGAVWVDFPTAPLRLQRMGAVGCPLPEPLATT